MSERSSTSVAPLVGVLGEHLGQPADQPSGRLVPGAGEHLRVGEHLGPGEAAGGPGLVLELGGEQRRHQVVGRVARPPVDVVGEHLAVGDGVLAHLHRPAGLGAQRGVGVVPDRRLVGLGDAEQHADHAHRHHRTELGDDVEPVGADERVEAADAERPHLVLEGGHAAGGEHARHQAPVHGVHRGVLEHDHARRELHARLDDLEDVAAGSSRSAASRRAPSRRRRGATAPRGRSARCGRSAPRRAGAGTSGTGRR